MANVSFHAPIPRFDTIRRVLSPYQRIFPLALMKEYQFVVIGAAGNTLTIAISDQQSRLVIESLNKLTGRAVFPVLVEPALLRLLLERIERCERRKYYQMRGRPYYLYSVQLQSIIQVFSMWMRLRKR
jgi:hypothetical protein